MNLKTIATFILSLSLVWGAEPGEFLDRERENLIVKEIPSGQALLMLQIRYEDDSEIKSGYAGPLLFMINKTPQSLVAVEMSMENCCSDEHFLIRFLGGLQPVPYWNSRGIEPTKGRSIAFPREIENDQIIPNDRVRISHFRVLSDDESGTAVIFIIGPLEDVQRAYEVRLGKVFNWKNPRVFE